MENDALRVYLACAHGHDGDDGDSVFTGFGSVTHSRSHGNSLLFFSHPMECSEASQKYEGEGEDEREEKKWSKNIYSI